MTESKSTLILVLTLILASCSFYPTTLKHKTTPLRSIANAEAHSSSTLQEILSFKSSAKNSDADVPSYLRQYLPQLIPGIKIEAIHDLNMPEEEAFRIEPVVSNNQYTVKIFYSSAAIHDEAAYYELNRFLGRFKHVFPSPYSLLEVFYNAKERDITALEVLAKIRAQSTGSDEDKTAWEKLVAELASQAKGANKEKKAKEEARKAVMDALDKASEDQQFRTLVAKNDRKGVVKLLRAYLPWDQMPPFEKKYWENHLMVMANPLPLEERIMVFRGIDDDMVQVAFEAGKDLPKEEALKEQKIFLMSTLLTKNQGSWNRRLRSLTAMYGKFIATTGENKNSEFTRAARITTMFSRHSTDPKGSPFLSLTPRFAIAKNFGEKRMTMYFLDPRLVHFNYASRYENEVEFLLPLVTFPDELAAVHDRTIHGTAHVESFLDQVAMERLGREFGEEKAPEVLNRIRSNSEKFFKPVSSKNGALPSSSNFFKQNLGVETKALAIKMGTTTEMPCMDLIQLFWK